MLIDFSQDDYTAATAAPEVMSRWLVREVDGKIIYTPRYEEKFAPNGEGTKLSQWPPLARERAEVYSLGRTIGILAEGVGMTELYLRLYADAEYEYRSVWPREMDGRAGRWVEGIVDACTRREPGERVGLVELEEMAKRWELEKRRKCGSCLLL